MPDEVDKRKYPGRRDLTSLNCFTIDGEDAKDLDDAIHVEKLPNGNFFYKGGILNCTISPGRIFWFA